MRALRRYAGGRPDIARAVKVISADEDNHLAYCHEELLRLAAAGHAQVIRRTLRVTALAEIGIYRDVSLAVMAHLGQILGWPRPKAAVLVAGIRAVCAYEQLGGWRAPGVAAHACPAQRAGRPGGGAHRRAGAVSISPRLVLGVGFGIGGWWRRLRSAPLARPAMCGPRSRTRAGCACPGCEWPLRRRLRRWPQRSGAAAAAVRRRCIAALAGRVRYGDRLHRAGQGDVG
jgi:hypothetical protein